MAKEYSAKLTLQDNWNQVIDKAITKTSKLIKEAQKLDKLKINPEVNIKTNKALMKQVENDLGRLKKSNINISTKLDSSFKSTVNALERAVPNKKVVSITAKEDVTKTLNNVEREVFTKTNKVNSIMKGSMKNLGGSISASVSPLGKLLSSITGAKALSALTSGSSASGAGIVGSAVAGGVSGTIMANLNKTKLWNGFISNGKNSLKGFVPVISGTFKDGFKRAVNYMNGIFDDADFFDEASEGIGGGIGGAWNIDSSFAKMIAKQKAKLKGLGMKNPLSQYQVQENRLGLSDPEDFGETALVLLPENAVAKALASIRSFTAKAKNLMSSAGNFLATPFRIAFSKITSALSPLGGKMASVFARIKNSAVLTGTKIGFSLQRGVGLAGTALGRIAGKGAFVVSKIGGIFAKLTALIPNPVLKGVAVATKAIAKITKGAFKFTIKAIDKTASVFKAIGGKIAGLVKAAGAITIGAATLGIKGMADREKQLVSIEHFMDVSDKNNNGGSNTMTSAQLNSNAKGYMGNLIKLADSTPFDTGDISAAGTRAIQMMNGDTSKALDMTKLAADMSSVTPGTTASDAMEALYDAQMGEFERLKQYGLKVSQADFKGLVGKGEGDDLTESETKEAFQKLLDGKVTSTFGGASEELSTTVAGKFSTITGKIKTGLTDVAMVFGGKMTAVMDKVNGIVDNLFSKDSSGNFTNSFVKGIIDGVGIAIEYFGKIRTALTPVVEAIGGVIQALAPKVLPVIDKIIQVFASLAPAFSSVIQMITPALDFFIGLFHKVADFIIDNSDSINKVVAAIGEAFEFYFGLIGGVVDAAWKVIEPILGWLMDKLGAVAGLLGDVIEKANSWDIGGKVSHAFSPSQWKMFGGDGYKNTKADGSHAVGLEYVPNNGYKAILHRGEQVLTRPEADRYRAGDNNKNQKMNVVINVYEQDNADKVAQAVYTKLMEASANMA